MTERFYQPSRLVVTWPNRDSVVSRDPHSLLIDHLHLQIRFLAAGDGRHVRCFPSYPLHFRRYRSSPQRMKPDRCFLTNKQRSLFTVKHDYILQLEIIVWFDILFSLRFDRSFENIVRIVSFDSFALSFHLKILYIRFTFVLFASFI
jgi:hypothetical protein